MFGNFILAGKQARGAFRNIRRTNSNLVVDVGSGDPGLLFN